MAEEQGLSVDPCPWCNTTAFLLCCEAATLQSYARGQRLAQIVCTNPVHNGVIEGPAATTSAPYIDPLATPLNPEAITAWNTRSEGLQPPVGGCEDKDLGSVGSGLTPLVPSPSASGLIAQPSKGSVSDA